MGKEWLLVWKGRKEGRRLAELGRNQDQGKNLRRLAGITKAVQTTTTISQLHLPGWRVNKSELAKREATTEQVAPRSYELVAFRRSRWQSLSRAPAIRWRCI